MGGETLLTANLEGFLREALHYPTIGTLILTTNGTVVPNEKILDIIATHKERFIINCSDYSALMGAKYAERRNRIVQLIRENTGFDPIVANPVWLKTSPPLPHHRSEAELIEQYAACMHIHGAYFTSLWDGKIFSCPRQGVFDLLGYPVRPEDYLDVRAFDSCARLREAIFSFYSREFYWSCDYCSNVEDAECHIPPGEQLAN